MSFQLGDIGSDQACETLGDFSSVSETFPMTASGNWCKNGGTRPAHVELPVSM